MKVAKLYEILREGNPCCQRWVVDGGAEMGAVKVHELWSNNDWRWRCTSRHVTLHRYPPPNTRTFVFFSTTTRTSCDVKSITIVGAPLEMLRLTPRRRRNCNFMSIYSFQYISYNDTRLCHPKLTTKLSRYISLPFLMRMDYKV